MPAFNQRCVFLIIVDSRRQFFFRYIVHVYVGLYIDIAPHNYDALYTVFCVR